MLSYISAIYSGSDSLTHCKLTHIDTHMPTNRTQASGRIDPHKVTACRKKNVAKKSNRKIDAFTNLTL